MVADPPWRANSFSLSTLAEVVAQFPQLFLATDRGQEWRLDTAFAILWPSERACGKLVARDDGCLD
jgi:hypothetical protein